MVSNLFNNRSADGLILYGRDDIGGARHGCMPSSSMRLKHMSAKLGTRSFYLGYCVSLSKRLDARSKTLPLSLAPIAMI